MVNSNGKNGTWVIRTLVGFLFIVVLTAITTLTSHTIANEEKCRNRDEKVTEKFNEAVLAQQQQNQDIKVDLAKILTELKHIKKDVRWLVEEELHELIHLLYGEKVFYKSLLDAIHASNEKQDEILTKIIIYIEHIEAHEKAKRKMVEEKWYSIY